MFGLFVTPEEHDFVRVVLKTDVDDAHVVDHEQINTLATKFLEGMLSHVVSLGGKTHNDLTRRALRDEIEHDVLSGLEVERGRTLFLLQFFLRSLEREVRDGRGHDDDVGPFDA